VWQKYKKQEREKGK